MTWVLMAAFGLASWLSAAMLILGLCRAARRADELGSVGFASNQGSGALSSESNVVDLSAFGASAHRPDACGSPYFSSLESRRSLSSLPSVWQVGQ
jgi:biopolymer transport protein ExbB/TolQ